MDDNVAVYLLAVAVLPGNSGGLVFVAIDDEELLVAFEFGLLLTGTTNPFFEFIASDEVNFDFNGLNLLTGFACDRGASGGVRSKVRDVAGCGEGGGGGAKLEGVVVDVAIGKDEDVLFRNKPFLDCRSTPAFDCRPTPALDWRPTPFCKPDGDDCRGRFCNTDDDEDDND